MSDGRICSQSFRIRSLRPQQAPTYLPRILALEAQIYEPARRDPPERLALAFESEESIALILEVKGLAGWECIGYALATPLERVAELPGPDRDPMLGRHNTLYSLALSVTSTSRGRGYGNHLKAFQLEVARRMRRAGDDAPRYAFVTSRNRVGAAEEMSRINRSFGAVEVLRLAHQYGDPAAEARYLRIDLSSCPLNLWRESRESLRTACGSHQSGSRAKPGRDLSAPHRGARGHPSPAPPHLAPRGESRGSRKPSSAPPQALAPLRSRTE